MVDETRFEDARMPIKRPNQIKTPPAEKLEFCHSELVIGLVCAVGTDYQPVRLAIENTLEAFGYNSRVIRISDLISRLTDQPLDDAPETARISSRMDAGNVACKESHRQDIWALAAIAEINRQRDNEPLAKTAHIILTLKRPEEVSMLRKVYGDGFLLISVYATEKERLEYLIEKNAPKDDALTLIRRDAEEAAEEFGQRTRDTFHLADVFVEIRKNVYQRQLQRFFDLVFSNPYITPTRKEHAMFLAYASSLRSSQLGRQVGAAITTRDGDVLAVGCNDVPKPRGGLYWPGPGDNRDHIRGIDTNDKQRDRLIDQLIATANEEGNRTQRVQSLVAQVLALGGELDDSKRAKVEDLLKSLEAEESNQAERLKTRFKGILDITEYGRAVHAEMDALLTCARSGVSPQGAILYTTTFPCHNCTRHIVAAGIRRVFYIEPYAKSRAEELHEDAILVEERYQKGRGGPNRIPFIHFVGIGPRRYFDLFSLNLSSGHELVRKKNGVAIPITKQIAWPRIPMSPYSYLEREARAIELLDKLTGGQQMELDGFPKE